MTRKLVAALVVLGVLGASGSAWALGVGVGYRLPVGDFNDAYDGGFGGNVTMSFPFTPLVTFYGDVGYTRFTGGEVDGFDVDDIDVWSFNAGGHVNLLFLYAGAEVGYFTEVDDFSISPLLGTHFGPIDISARYKLTGENWFDLRAAISFGP